MSGSDRVVAGRYRLESELGRGGMGVVWRAVDTLIERTVALKELRAPVGDEASFVERALREARNAGRLNHPGVVAVHDVIAPTRDDDAAYIVMELIEAPSLAEVIDRQGALPPARVAAMGLGILDALTAAHAIGIVHRDIKPGNVLVADGDRVKLTDFGIALAAEDSRLTRSGVLGTHAYLAPECFDNGQVGPATDLWALGATLFHAVAARPPFERETTTATLRAILFEEPPPPPCGPPLATAITGLLTRPVDQRLTSATARELLQDAAATPTPVAPPKADPDQAGWQAQATTTHRPPAPVPGHTTHPDGPPPPFPTTRPAGPGGHTTQPGGPPPSYVTAQHAAPPPHPPAMGPMSMSGLSPAGPPPPRNNTPLILGVLGAVAAALLLVIIFASTGGDDDDGGGGSGEQAGGLPTIPEPIPPETEPDGSGLADDDDLDSTTTTNSQGCCDGGAGAEALALELITAVNSGDEATAAGTLCSDSHSAPDITEAIAGDASLDPDPSTVENGDDQYADYSASLIGVMDGEPITAGYVSVYPEDAGWCVYMFYAM